MKISVVTPSFNQASYIERTIRSILDQKGDFDLQHIVVDGVSTDGTLDILNKFRASIELVSEPDTGQSNAINKGFRLATGDVVCWLNSDDIFLPGCLQTVTNAFNENGEIDWVYGKVKIIDTDDNEIRKGITRYKDGRMRSFSFERLLQECWISQMGVFWRRDFGEKIGELDESLQYSMDYDLWLRFAKQSPGHFIDQYLSAFRWHGESKTSQNFVDQAAESLRLVQQHSEGKHPLSVAAHRLLAFRTRVAYRVLNLLSR